MRTPGKRILFASLPILLLVLVESAVRVRYYFWSQDTRFLLWGFKQDAGVQRERKYLFPPNTILVGPHVPGGARINRLGLRGKDFEREPPPNTLRILALGESSTWGSGNRDGETWPEQLEAKLNRLYSPQRFEVVNLGIPGGHVDDLKAVFDDLLEDGYRFHIGILYLGWNHLGRLFQMAEVECQTRYSPASVRILHKLSNTVLSFLILREKVSIWAGQGLKGPYGKVPWWSSCSEKEVHFLPEDWEAMKKKVLSSRERKRALSEELQKRLTGANFIYAEELERLIKEGQSLGMKFLNVRQAHLPHYDPHDSNPKYMPLIWELTEDLIRPLKVPSFDMHAYFKKAGHPEALFQNYPKDGIHLTAQGNALVAEGLIEAFRNLGWIPAR